MTQLSRLAHLGLAKESVVGTYLAPTTFIPFTKADYEDLFTEIKDESIRANDSVIQGLYQGVVEGDWGIDLMAYPDVVGHFLRGIIGPDTASAGISTTVAANSIVGATTLSSTASISALSYISVGTGASLEYAYVTAVSGVGPYSLTVTTVVGQAVGLVKAHTMTTDPIVSQTTHTFKQSPSAAKATYSLTVYDTSTGTPTLGYSGAAFSDVQFKIDPKGAVTLTTKLKSQPGVSQSTPTPTYTVLPPVLGWQWAMTNAGGASTRGLTFDLSVKRALEAIHASSGLQAPREIFQGALEASGTYKALFENLTDLNLFTNYTQTPTTALLQQPAVIGGASLALTLSQSGWFKGKRDLSSQYLQANFSIEGIYNATDSGSVSAVLKNYVAAAY
ncbi:MAG: phage tail tube protein [Candidatus Dormibacteria bacterium]